MKYGLNSKPYLINNFNNADQCITDFQTNVTYSRLITCSRLQWLVTCKDFRLSKDGSNWVAETWRSNLNNNKLINEKLICAFRWSVLPSIMKMHGPKNKTHI